MPLKHLTETVLVIVLAVIILLTAVVLSTLPFLPLGFLPWAVTMVLTLVYPAALARLLRKNRADYEFRALHYAPAGMAAIWFLIQAISLKAPAILRLHRWLLWGSGLPLVALSLMLLGLFCFHVLRRRIPRISVLAALLLAYVGYGVLTEATPAPTNTLASVLWSSPIWGKMTSETLLASVPSVSEKAVEQGSGKNLTSSMDPDEEAWRAKLRAMEESSSSVPSSAAETIAAVSSSSNAASLALLTEKPKVLPGAGLDFTEIASLVFALYLGAIHVKTRKRSLEIV